MNQEEKQLLINRQVEKSHHFIRQSEEMMTLGHSDLAVNRYYYACFHIVQALFLQKGISVRTHSGMISQFSQHFVKTGNSGRKRTTIARTMLRKMKQKVWRNQRIVLWRRLLNLLRNRYYRILDNRY